MTDGLYPNLPAPAGGGTEVSPNLCRPAPELSCFRCCPPIRPAGYDHLDHRAELLRQFIANTEDFRAGRRGREIVGFSCWGLGLVDPGKGLVGCLLHPAQNGEDLRDRTGYGEKCRREVCPQQAVFGGLEEPLRRALLAPLLGLDSFRFSSPRANPLWNLLLWGREALTRVGAGLSPKTPLYGFLASHPEPRSRAFLLSGLLDRLAAAVRGRILSDSGFGPWFEERAGRIRRELGSTLPQESAEAPPVHRLGLETALDWFIRFGLGRRRMDREAALGLARAAGPVLDHLAEALIGRGPDPA